MHGRSLPFFSSFGQAGANLSVTGNAEEDGDGTSMVFRIPESLVNIAQILK